MDPLFLNVSDLRDVECTIFPSSFESLVLSDPLLKGNDDFENITVSLQHARTWLDGRFLDVSNLDEVLGLFHASPGQNKTLNRGQFFAILRIISHVQSGAKLDRSLVFEQPKRDITPKEHSLGFKTIKELISEEYDSVRKIIKTFLRSPEPPIWKPPKHAEDYDFLARLQLPTYRNGRPSLLLHDLVACDRLEEFNVSPICICNTSGSGKTRLMMEIFTKKWGFYLVATPDPNGVGVGDLQRAMGGCEEYSEWVEDLNKIPPEEWTAQSHTNSQIATKLLKKVLVARTVVFKLFLELAIEVDGSLQEKHKRLWLLFQIFDRVTPHSTDLHPFISITMDCLRLASTDALDQLLEDLKDICKRYLPGEGFIIGLDEAQHAVRSYPRSFVSSFEEKAHRSFLREMVKVFTGLGTKPGLWIKLIVSGTSVSIGDLKVSLASSVSKPRLENDIFHDLGMFDTWPKLEKFITRYLPPSYLKTPSGYHLQRRMREYLLGRYRFSVSYLEYLLRNGLRSPHKLLNEYINGHMYFIPDDCFPGDRGDPFTSDEPELEILVEVQGFEWHRLQADPAGLRQAASIVQSHLTRGASPTFGPVNPELVDYGLARLRANHKGAIVEPLAFLSLVRWFESRPNLTVKAGLESQLCFDSSRGHAYEQVVILYLLRAMRFPVPFRQIFDFYGTLPSWADETARVVGHIDGAAVAVDVLGNAPQNPGLGVVEYAANIKEVLKWIENPTTAVLVPSNLFGPDLLLWCNDVLVMGQLKSYTEGNKECLDATTISQALTSLHSSHWFKSSTEKERAELIRAIQRHRVLRFVGAYPLRPNFYLRADSVKKALALFDPDVVLATLDFDEFRSRFISQDQASLLAPMDHALERRRRKRGADEMSS